MEQMEQIITELYTEKIKQEFRAYYDEHYKGKPCEDDWEMKKYYAIETLFNDYLEPIDPAHLQFFEELWKKPEFCKLTNVECVQHKWVMLLAEDLIQQEDYEMEQEQ